MMVNFRKSVVTLKREVNSSLSSESRDPPPLSHRFESPKTDADGFYNAASLERAAPLCILDAKVENKNELPREDRRKEGNFKM